MTTQEDHEVDLWRPEIEELLEKGFATVSRNPSDHEVFVAHRMAIHLASIAAEQRIVAWLREHPEFDGEDFGPGMHLAARAIEAGEHLGG